LRASRPTPWLRLGVFSLTGLVIISSAVAMFVDGRVPASVPPAGEAPGLAMGDLLEALTAVDSRGNVNLEQLKAHHGALERYVSALARTSPATEPARYPSPDDRVAYWLNAAQALVLLELLDVRSASTATTTNLSWHLRGYPVGGQRLTRFAINRRFLEATGDARVALALFTGAKGAGVLDGAPFDGATLDSQLDDAVRRFMQRPSNVRIDGHVVHLSTLFREHQDALLAALPEGRKSVLQVVWAYLPDRCDGQPGCATRGDLDLACGPKFDGCTVTWEPVDFTLAVTH
jgi:Protein of unknown function, DUF547